MKPIGEFSALLGLALQLVSLSVSSAALRAGAASVDVTPHHLPVRVAGGIRETLTSEVGSALHAKAVLLDDGVTRVALGVVDNCLLDLELLDGVKEEVAERTGIPHDRILISATHTHSAPPVVGVHGSDPDLVYRAQLFGSIVQSFLQAEANLEPAELTWGTGQCEGYVFCRRWEMKPGTAKSVRFTGRSDPDQAQMNPGHQNPDRVRATGPVDPEVTVWAVRAAADSRPLAVFANYSTHYVGAPGVSADYFGVFGEKVGELLGAVEAEGRPPFVGVLSNGTSGDANSIDFTQPAGERASLDEVAGAVAAVAVRALEDASWRREVPLRMVERAVTLNVRMPAWAEVDEARRFLEDHLPEDGKVADWDQNYARETVLLSEMPPVRKLRLQALAFGDAFAVTAIPCEVFGSTGLAIKAQSPFPLTMNVGLANGYSGYLPPPDQFDLGGYTTWRARSSCLQVDAEPAVRRQLAALLDELWRRR